VASGAHRPVEPGKVLAVADPGLLVDRRRQGQRQREVVEAVRERAELRFREARPALGQQRDAFVPGELPDLDGDGFAEPVMLVDEQSGTSTVIALNVDYEVLLGFTVLATVATILGNLLADIGYAILDPRVRYS